MSDRWQESKDFLEQSDFGYSLRYCRTAPFSREDAEHSRKYDEETLEICRNGGHHPFFNAADVFNRLQLMKIEPINTTTEMEK